MQNALTDKAEKFKVKLNQPWSLIRVFIGCWQFDYPVSNAVTCQAPYLLPSKAFQSKKNMLPKHPAIEPPKKASSSWFLEASGSTKIKPPQPVVQN